MYEKAKKNVLTAEWAETQKYYDVAVSRYYYSLYQKLIFIAKEKQFLNKLDEITTPTVDEHGNQMKDYDNSRH